MRNIFHSLFGQLSNICSQMCSLKCQIKDQMWGRSDGNHVVRIFKYQIEECEGHHVENIKYKIEEPPHHVVRVLLLKPDEGWACGGGLCKKIEPNKKFHKIKTASFVRLTNIEHSLPVVRSTIDGHLKVDPTLTFFGMWNVDHDRGDDCDNAIKDKWWQRRQR